MRIADNSDSMKENKHLFSLLVAHHGHGLKLWGYNTLGTRSISMKKLNSIIIL